MAEYYVDKIKYSGNTYKLLDNGALHTNGILTGTTGTFAADKGIFNKLIATNANIGTLDVNNLTAQNAKVLGLLDVQGEMHTKSWTNANIANIGGSFYISPTVSTVIAETSASEPMSIAIGGSAGERTFQVTGGNFATDAVKTYNDSTKQTTTVDWSVGSHVMVTGNIRLTATGVDYPLGTLNGYLTSPVITGGPSALVADGFTIGKINSPALETIISELGTANLKSYEIKISMIEIGPETAPKPVGIMMTSYGVDKSTYLDIYGGVNQKNSGAVNPNLRIGYLGGLPGFTVDGKTTVAPTGWGIYTDNGFFKGVIAATSGLIGGWNIGANSIHSNGRAAWNTDSDGIWVAADVIAGGENDSDATPAWYIKADGSAKFGKMTLTSDGNLSVPAANIEGTFTIGQLPAITEFTGINNYVTNDKLESELNDISDTKVDKTSLHGKFEWSDDAAHISSSNSNEYYETEIGGTGINFKYGANSETANVVASITKDQLVIYKTIVLKEMLVGESDTQRGLWAWNVRDNQHLQLKWKGGN